MKAYEIYKVDGFNQLRLVDRLEPTSGAGQVLVKVRATSINDRDRTILKGTYPFALNLPLIPLSDGVGEVVALGEGVTRVKIGDRVFDFEQAQAAFDHMDSGKYFGKVVIST